VIFWLLMWGLATAALPELAPGYGAAAYWATGAVVAAAFLVSLLAHEMSHSLVARRDGIEVESITLWVLGGVAALRGEASGPRSELRIAAAGPAASAAVGLGALGVAAVLRALGAPDLAVAATGWLGTINLVLAVFNLAPAAPLDGGRILRALLWRHHGDRVRAAVSAARAGRVFGYVLIGLGLLEFAAGGGIGGLWLIFLGWFVLSAARAEETSTLVVAGLAGVTAAEVMTPDPIVVDACRSVDEVVHDSVLRHHCSSFPVVDHGRVVGLLTLRRIRAVPAHDRASTSAGAAAWPLAEVPRARPDEPLLGLLDRVGASGPGDGRVLVFDGDRLVGIVSPTDVQRAVQIRGEWSTGGGTTARS